MKTTIQHKVPNIIAVKLSKRGELAIKKQHPWIFESSIVKENKEPSTGDIAIVFDKRNNKCIGIGLFDCQSLIRIRIIHFGGSKKVNKDFFEEKIDQALSKRKALFFFFSTGLRLIYGENDGFSGLIVDQFSNVLVIKLYSGIWIPYLELIIEILKEKVDISSLVLRLSRKLQEEGQLSEKIIFGEIPNDEVIFKEHGINFIANPVNGHKTGFFLDHRNNRLKTRKYTQDKNNVLDVFSYSGGFTTSALVGGAKSVTSIDISSPALQSIKRNLDLNLNNYKHTFLKGDAFQLLKQLNTENKKFDYIIIDPPSLAKRQSEVDRAMLKYKQLVRLGTQLISNQGIFLMCSCSSRIDKETFYNLVTTEIKKSARKFSILEKTSHDVDHPEGIPELNYLKSIYIQFK